MTLMTNHPLTPGTDKSTSSAVLELIPQLLPGLIPVMPRVHDSHQVPSQPCPLWSSRAPTLPHSPSRGFPALVSIPLSGKGNIFPGAASIHYHKVPSLGLQLIIHLSLEDGCSIPLEFKYSWAREGGRAVWEVWHPPPVLPAPRHSLLQAFPSRDGITWSRLTWTRFGEGDVQGKLGWMRFWTPSGADGAVPLSLAGQVGDTQSLLPTQLSPGFQECPGPTGS